jgi:predicted DNA-binding protein (UPF0251 family)
MPRPQCFRRVWFEPNFTYFKPAGISMIDLEESILTVDEFEAVRLKDLEGLDEHAAAKKMNISQPTFNRIVSSARKKISDAIVNGKAIKIEGGHFKLVRATKRRFRCCDCGNAWELAQVRTQPSSCPKCKGKNIRRPHIHANSALDRKLSR